MKASTAIDLFLIKLLGKNAENNGGKLTPAADNFRVDMGIARVLSPAGIKVADQNNQRWLFLRREITDNYLTKYCEQCGVKRDE